MKKFNIKLNKKINILFIAFSVVSVICIGTFAYLQWKSKNENTFTSEQTIVPSINEIFQDNEKRNVSVFVGDTGYSVYVRATIVVNWMDEDQHILGASPILDTTENEGDYSLLLNTTDWFFNDDGFYYYKKPVSSGQSTEALIEECTILKNAPKSNYTLNVEIIAQTIQVAGLTDDTDIPLVTSAWGVTVNSDKTLSN